MTRQWVIILGMLALLSCREEADTVIEPLQEPLLAVPKGFPAPVFPDDNPFSEAAWALGKKLFYDTRLSDDGSVSCASCHLPGNAFSDTVAFSAGVAQRPGTRNAPSLANVAYHPYYTREGGVPTLEMQVLVPVQEHNEFDSNILEIAERLEEDQEYQELAAKAFGRELDYYVIPRALATFERSMLSGSSRYDRHVSGTGDLDAREKAGMDLFFSDRTGCADCHSGFNFTSYGFANTGLYGTYEDPGRQRLTGTQEDLALFKVPSLRNVEVTGPYMHDGSVATLEAVVEHYDGGGEPHPNKSGLVRPLGLTGEEKAALVAFLKTLTDHAFINNKKFRNE